MLQNNRDGNNQTEIQQPHYDMQKNAKNYNS